MAFGAALALLAGLLLYVFVFKNAAGHPTHANTRFPGFFMHPSDFRLPLEPGQKLSWSWPWQPVREGGTPDEGSIRIVAELAEYR